VVLFLLTIKIGDYIKQYNGGDSEKEAIKFIKNWFRSMNRSPKEDRELYIHVTNATDTENITKVFNSLIDTFVSDGLGEFFA